MLASCGTDKTAATAAINTAETAWAAAKDNITKVLPEDAKSVEGEIAVAKASLEQGDAKGALAAAQALPARIQQLTASLPAKEAELRGVWDTLNASLPNIVLDVQQRMDKLSKSAKLPAGIEQAAFDGAKSTFDEAKQMWGEAQTAQQGGNIGDAVIKALGVKERIAKVLTALQMPVPAALAS
jgi:hypothetical protein